ncbi:MAG: Rpn family recombination-promoting nuclease/putative transposase [Spirochaetota bacterium]|jgi:predicted transposase/invertase (TIGR01784 family)|nr:Rpn family recombination-promoting nuclease/putative transposase [Spirochaetota bacterium]
MTKLDFSFTDDILFKMLFVRYPNLLKKLVAALLDIQLESIEQFDITNSEIPPNVIGDKFCRLDINMVVDKQRVDLEIQVADEGDYPERSLYYWAREYSSALSEGHTYRELPRTIIISIIAFNLFECAEFYSEFQALEVARHTLLTDKMRLCYFELSKLPKVVGADDELKLWLSLFKAKTEEDLQKIEALGVPIMEQAIEAYRQTKAMNEFRELERLRSLARHNEASALDHAAKVEREKWQAVVAEKDAELAELERLRSLARHNEASALDHAERKAEKAEREKWQAVVAEKDAALTEKEAVYATALAEKDALIAELRALNAKHEASEGKSE